MFINSLSVRQLYHQIFGYKAKIVSSGVAIKYLLLVVIVVGNFGCREDVDKSQLAFYEGPYRTSFKVELLHSDSAIVRTKLMADKQLEFKNGDAEFPEGVVIHFYDKEGELSTTIRADRGYLDRKTNVYRGEGDVQVHNLVKEQKLNSEELFWDKGKKKIYTEKFVTVEQPDRIIKGTGMEADEGFNEYKFTKVTGEIDNVL